MDILVVTIQSFLYRHCILYFDQFHVKYENRHLFGVQFFIDCEAGEIIRLVASVRLSAGALLLYPFDL